MRAEHVRGRDVLLLIEIADTSLHYDLGEKAALYRQHGVRDYWVIDLVSRQTHVHRLGGAWPEPPVSFETIVAASLIAGLTVRLADLI